MMIFRERLNDGCSSFLVLFLLLILATISVNCIDNLRVSYQWKIIDFAWPDNETRQLFPHYVQENHNPMGLVVAGDRIFVTVPRWKFGVAATLNYINLNDTNESPLLNPYPSWDAHRLGNGSFPEVVSVFRIWADRCDRLWVLDLGIDDLMYARVQLVPPKLVVYNLTNDKVIRNYVIPSDQYPTRLHFANLVVEEGSNCDEYFAYFSEIRGPGLIVYSWANNNSWLIKHQYFNPDPLHSNFNVSGLFFQWWDGIINTALLPREDGYSTMYFHPLCSNDEFSVSTEILRNSELASSPSSFHEYKYLGSRGSNSQGAASYLDPASGILFHALSIANAISCWNPASGTYSPETVARVYADNTTLVFPGDIKVDDNGKIWVFSNRLPIFMYSELDFDDYNYRILTGSVEEAIAGTVCSSGTNAKSEREALISIIVALFLIVNG